MVVNPLYPHVHQYAADGRCEHCGDTLAHQHEAQYGDAGNFTVLERHFQQALKQLLRMEGGLAENPNDPGGITKCGISLRFIRDHGIDIDGDGVITPDDIKMLKVDRAGRLYRHFWWDTAGGRPNPAPSFENLGRMLGMETTALLCFQFAANIGYNPTVTCLQRALSAYHEKRIADDGIIGRNTTAALKEAMRSRSPADRDFPDMTLPRLLRSEVAGHYRLLAEKHPKLRTFLKGWLNRAYELGWVG